MGRLSYRNGYRLNIIKQIIKYTLWTILSIALAIFYLTLIIKPYELSNEGIDFLLLVFYSHGIFFIGLIIGLVIAFLFVLLDNFYLKRKYSQKNSTLTRFSLLLVITAFVTILHYLLEKVIDVI